MLIVPDILEAFIQSLDLTFAIDQATYDGTNTVISIENTLHLRPGLSVDLSDGVLTARFSVVAVDSIDNTVTVAGDATSYTSATLPTPFFFHGTAYAVNSHISRLDDAAKVPMIYLHEIIRVQIGDREETRGRYTQVRLFFLDVANYADWDTDEHYSEVVVPQLKLSDYFIAQSRQSPKFFLDDRGGTQIAHVKFGQFMNEKGHLQSIFNDRLSGAELNFEFLFKSISCN